MQNSFYILKDNKKIKCDILYIFNSSNDNFIIYNDGSLDEDGFLNVFANKFIMDNDKLNLLPILDTEWDIIDNVWRDINE